MSKVNWEQIEVEYIAGSMSYRDIAEKYSVAQSRVSKVAAENKWYSKRKKYRANVAQNSLSNARVRTVKENTEKLTNLIKAADKMSAYLNSILDDADSQFKKHILTMSTGKQRVEDTEKIDTRAVIDIVNAINKMTETTRNLNNILTLPEQTKVDVQKQKLEKDGESKDTTVIVKLDGDVEKWAK